MYAASSYSAPVEAWNETIPSEPVAAASTPPTVPDPLLARTRVGTVLVPNPYSPAVACSRELPATCSLGLSAAAVPKEMTVGMTAAFPTSARFEESMASAAAPPTASATESAPGK